MSYAFPTAAEREYFRRLGGLMHDDDVEHYEPEMRSLRARQICRTWRPHLAWHLANALGWRGPQHNNERPETARRA